jgi:hypothetical protein
MRLSAFYLVKKLTKIKQQVFLFTGEVLVEKEVPDVQTPGSNLIKNLGAYLGA